MKEHLTRRDLIRKIGLGAAALATTPINQVLAVTGKAADERPAGFVLPPLPYAYSALEPHLDARTMEIHHGKHHLTYVNSLNAALKDHPDLLRQPIEQLLKNLNDLPETVRTPVRNFGGGHYNHMLYWTFLKPGGGGEPTGHLAAAIQKYFGSFAAFKEQLSAAAVKQFGSGWGWLVKNRDGSLAIISTSNQDSPVSNGQVPLLTVDVWEHAYYLHYQNRRADFVSAWWNVVNWDAVAMGLDR
jgi:Fe-Mn family superoxide dismutase